MLLGHFMRYRLSITLISHVGLRKRAETRGYICRSANSQSDYLRISVTLQFEV
jgi:hypothetical protein